MVGKPGSRAAGMAAKRPADDTPSTTSKKTRKGGAQIPVRSRQTHRQAMALMVLQHMFESLVCAVVRFAG